MSTNPGEDQEESKIAEVIGHAHGSMTGSRYGKKFDPKGLKKAIETLDFQGCLEGHLKRG